MSFDTKCSNMDKSGEDNTDQSDSRSMGKEERVRQVLGLLVESELDLPPRVILHNCKKRGATFERRTVHRYLDELAEEGHVKKVEGTDGYYRATQSGRDYYFNR